MIGLVILIGLTLFFPLIAFVMWAEENYIRHKNEWRKTLTKPVFIQKKTFGFKHKREKFPEFNEE